MMASHADPVHIAPAESHRPSLLFRLITSEKHPIGVLLGLAGILFALLSAIAHQSPIQITTVELTILLLGAVFEVGGSLAKQTDALRDSLMQEGISVCWRASDAIAALKALQDNPRDHIKAVWSPLPYADTLKEYMDNQLRQLADGVQLERYVDVARVPLGDLLDHLRRAISPILRGQYCVYLVPSANFGALLVNGDKAAVNFPCSERSGEVISLSSFGGHRTFVQRVSRMLEELGKGDCVALDLPSVLGSKIMTHDDAFHALRTLATSYYEAHHHGT